MAVANKDINTATEAGGMRDGDTTFVSRGGELLRTRQFFASFATFAALAASPVYADGDLVTVGTHVFVKNTGADAIHQTPNWEPFGPYVHSDQFNFPDYEAVQGGQQTRLNKMFLWACSRDYPLTFEFNLTTRSGGLIEVRADATENAFGLCETTIEDKLFIGRLTVIGRPNHAVDPLLNKQVMMRRHSFRGRWLCETSLESDAPVNFATRRTDIILHDMNCGLSTNPFMTFKGAREFGLYIADEDGDGQLNSHASYGIVADDCGHRGSDDMIGGITSVLVSSTNNGAVDDPTQTATIQVDDATVQPCQIGAKVVLEHKVAIAAADIVTLSNSRVITVTQPGHLFENNDHAAIAGLTATVFYNGIRGSNILGRRKVTVIDANTYSFQSEAGAPATSSGAIAAPAQIGPVCAYLITQVNTGTNEITVTGHLRTDPGAVVFYANGAGVCCGARDETGPGTAANDCNNNYFDIDATRCATPFIIASKFGCTLKVYNQHCTIAGQIGVGRTRTVRGVIINSIIDEGSMVQMIIASSQSQDISILGGTAIPEFRNIVRPLGANSMYTTVAPFHSHYTGVENHPVKRAILKAKLEAINTAVITDANARAVQDEILASLIEGFAA